ncbi:MAG TPA: sulfatase [Bryobacteraceae bacterium]|nr:sulfatase [Bryobacteraceae bacterium]
MTRRNFLSVAAASAVQARSAAPPNVVLIVCDDLGYGDLGCYGGSLRTPHLDRMGSEGVRFTQFYSANPVCSPSRAALMTGRYPTRAGVPRVLFPKDTTGLAQDETTIAQVLKRRGYRSMCVGKWHLGHLPQFLPTARGFDGYFGIPYSNDMEPPVLLRDTEVAEPRARMDRITGQYTAEAVRFIESAKDSPFFLYMPHTMPHIPLGASERFRGKSGRGLYGDVVAEIDWSVGEVLAALKRHELDSNTLVLFSSDNGPWYEGSPGRLRGRKGSTYEGGVRVPFIAKMPGRIPAGRVARQVGSLMDVMPTVARLAGAEFPSKPVDGIDLWPVLTGTGKPAHRGGLLYFDDTHLQCIRHDRWKLHVARYTGAAYSPSPQGARRNLPLAAPELYDIENDSDESYDVSPEHPKIVRDLYARAERLLADFPENIRKDWEDTKAKAVVPAAIGAHPRAADK